MKKMVIMMIVAVIFLFSHTHSMAGESDLLRSLRQEKAPAVLNYRPTEQWIIEEELSWQKNAEENLLYELQRIRWQLEEMDRGY